LNIKAIGLCMAAIMVTGCSTQKVAEEYGSNFGKAAFGCPGEPWTSKIQGEKYCLLTSVTQEFNHMLAEDTGETWGDAIADGLTLGISALFRPDIEEKWLRAAKEFANERYGEGSRVINFRPNGGQYKAMAFEVLPPADADRLR